MYNHTTIIGRLTRDPELRFTQSGKAVCSATIASNKKYGEDKEKVLFLDLTIWEKRGESFSKHFKKGDPVLVEGSLENQEWTDKEGNKRTKILLTVQNWEFLPSTKKEESKAADNSDMKF